MRTSSIVLASFLVLACGGGAATSETASETTAGDTTSGEATAAPREDGLAAEGSAAPSFAAPDQSGAERTLAAERGHAVVLYFYPRDATPGCTREACGFRDAWARYQEVGAQVFGVSTDDVASHAAFAAEHQLPFPLLADTEARIADAYGVSHDGGYAQRVTFVIDAEGRIARVFPSVDPGVHADEVLAAIAALSH